MNLFYTSQKLAQELRVEIESMKLKQEVVVTTGVYVLNRLLCRRESLLFSVLRFNIPIIPPPIRPLPTLKGLQMSKEMVRGGECIWEEVSVFFNNS